MKAQIQLFHSPDVPALETYIPSGDFSFLLQLFIGPEGGDGHESFELIVCNVGWVSKQTQASGAFFGRHTLIMNVYEYEKMVEYITEYVQNCEADNWNNLAGLIGRIGKWEFEDYADG